MKIYCVDNFQYSIQVKKQTTEHKLQYIHTISWMELFLPISMTEFPEDFFGVMYCTKLLVNLSSIFGEIL